MEKARVYLFLALMGLLASCAGKIQYLPPVGTVQSHNSIKINMSKERLWKRIIPALARSFFVINNLDKDSGIINVSYSGDPEKYVDCGRIKSYVRNLRGERTYDFSASKANQQYEAMDKRSGALYFLERQMSLEGRINIIVEEISANECKITVNTKYVLTKSISIKQAGGGLTRHRTNTISFVTGQTAKFPSGTICRPNGILESEILSILQSAVK